MRKEKPTTKLCKHCKTEIPYDAKVCPQCRRRVKGGKLKFILLFVIVLIVVAAIFGESSYDLSDDAVTMSEDDYKSACVEISYKDLARNAEDIVGKKLEFTGEIQQVVYDSQNGASEYLISVTQDEYGFWSDNVYVLFDTSSLGTKLLDEDIVHFYGEVSGTKSYTSVLGESITVPKITAVYMSIDED